MGGSGELGVVIVAAGSGARFGDTDKVLAQLGGRPLLAHALVALAGHPDVRETVLVLGEHTFERGAALVTALGLARVRTARGGATRSDSVRAGITALGEEIGFVAVHDAARPLVRGELLTPVVVAARVTGAAVPGAPVSDTILVEQAGRIGATPERATLRAAQTPQVARRDWLLDALDRADGQAPTDEGGMLHAAGYPVALVDGDPENIKITWPRDLVVAEAILAGRGAAI